jgi:type I restriction enzyme S subunit
MSWTAAKLSSFCEITSSKRIFASDYVSEGVPFFRGKEISEKFNGAQSLSTELFISRQKFEEIASKFGAPKEGDLLLTSVGTLGVPYRVRSSDEFYFKDGNLTWFREFCGINSAYLYYWLLSPPGRAQLGKSTIGTSQAAYTIELLKQMEICVPRPPVQDTTVAILSAYDDLIDNNRRRMVLLEEEVRQLYHEWFVRLCFPGHEHTRITDGVPDEWERVPVPEAISINPRTSLSDDDEHWWVEMADLPTNGMVIQNTIKRDGRSGSKFRNGDTLFARITPCLENGKTAFVNFMAENEVGRGSTEFIVLRSMGLTPEFVYCLARTYDFREHAIKSMIGASGRQRVQESCFEKFMILVPSRSLLALFGESAEPVFEQIKILHAQNQKLRTARDLLLPRLMSGEIAV